MIRLIIFALVMMTSLSGEVFTHLKSDQMHYEGRLILLEGNVELKGEKGEIRADLAHVPFSKKEAVLKGNIEIRFPSGEVLNCQSTDFRLDQQTAHFKDHVIFRNSDGSLLHADKMTVKFSGHEIQNVEAEGDVKLDRNGEWELHADRATYDKKENVISCTSDSSVTFQDEKGRMFAKSAVFDLTFQECILEGDVKMIHREGPLEQFAIAERVILSKERKEARFFCQKGGRVLFYDRVNRLQMSAPQINIVKDPSTNQNAVKGVGKVRFHFKDEEYERLRQYFLLEKVNG